MQDLDKPRVIGSFWGEVNSNIHRALGCVGTITDGAIRDVDEMTNAGFKALARRLCVGHALVHPGALELRGRSLRHAWCSRASSSTPTSTASWSSPPKNKRPSRTRGFMDCKRVQHRDPRRARQRRLHDRRSARPPRRSIADFSANVRAKFQRDGEW